MNIKYDKLLGKLRESNECISLTLAELQQLQFTDAPAPTGVTIMPDAVGDNPVTLNLMFALEGYLNTIPSTYGISLFSENIEVLIGDDTTELIFDYENKHDWVRWVIWKYAFEGTDYQYYTSYGNGSLLEFPLDLGLPNTWYQNPVADLDYFNSYTVFGAVLPLGQQYYITDKYWLLYVDQPTVLKPVKGSLHIFNGETLPDGIEPDVLLIDTGILDWDISPVDGVPLDIFTPLNYIPNEITVLNNCDSEISSYINLKDSHGSVIIQKPGSPFSVGQVGVFKAAGTHIYGSASLYNETHYTFDVTCNGSYNIRAILAFNRSEFSHHIPVPHIVSAVTSEDGRQVIIKTDSIIRPFEPILASSYSFRFNADLVALTDSLEFVDNNTLNVNLSTPIRNGVDLLFSFRNFQTIKNTWGGLLAEVLDFPVVNNVPGVSAPILLSVIIEGPGLMRLKFDQIMSNPNAFNADVRIIKNGNLLSNFISNMFLDSSDHTQFTISPWIQFVNTDVITISIVSGHITNESNVLLENITNFPVTNNLSLA